MPFIFCNYAVRNPRQASATELVTDTEYQKTDKYKCGLAVNIYGNLNKQFQTGSFNRTLQNDDGGSDTWADLVKRHRGQFPP